MRLSRAKVKAVARTERVSHIPSLAMLAILSAVVLALAGCNTVSGVGEDIGAAGGAIDQTSERTQDEITGKSPGSSSSEYQSGRY
jgi:predicted small secreted protein